MLHVSVFEVIGGMAVSWLACNLGAVVVYFSLPALSLRLVRPQMGLQAQEV
ncbi:hypothetical protein ACFTAO_39270 [Paenibacillus rhizoplanae]